MAHLQIVQLDGPINLDRTARQVVNVNASLQVNLVGGILVEEHNLSIFFELPIDGSVFEAIVTLSASEAEKLRDDIDALLSP